MAEATETEFLKLALMGKMVNQVTRVLWKMRSFSGGGGVGKSNITMRIINGEFKDYYDPTIEDSYMKYNYMVDEEPISLEIMDTAGQDAFIGARNAYYQSNDGFVFVYSVTDK